MSGNNTIDFNIVIIRNTDFADPFMLIPFLWMLGGFCANVGATYFAATGRLINRQITKQVLVVSILAVVWLFFYIIQSFFVTHRSIMCLIIWFGYILTLLGTLQHIELLKLFVCLSEYWTEEKLIRYQKIICAVHFILNSVGYCWPLGLETDRIATLATDLGLYLWIAAAFVSNYICAYSAMHLMWKHIKESKKYKLKSSLPVKQYQKAMTWIAAHASFDIVAFIAYGFLKFTATGLTKLNFLWSRVSICVISYHVAVFPIVFCQIRDLKFSRAIKLKLNTKSGTSGWKKLKLAVMKLSGSKSTRDHENQIAKTMEPISPATPMHTTANSP